jgi:hypothetical protein
MNGYVDKTFATQNLIPNQNYSTIDADAGFGQNDDSVVIEEPQKDVSRKEKYQYRPKPGELHERDIILSSGNVYHEKKNPAVAKLLNATQNNIQQSHNNRFERRRA